VVYHRQTKCHLRSDKIRNIIGIICDNMNKLRTDLGYDVLKAQKYLADFARIVDAYVAADLDKLSSISTKLSNHCKAARINHSKSNDSDPDCLYSRCLVPGTYYEHAATIGDVVHECTKPVAPVSDVIGEGFNFKQRAFYVLSLVVEYF
jgi:hypothetical protein